MVEVILDASQIETFETCPRKWYYSYVLNLLPKKSSKAFSIGSYYHEVLARYYYLPLRTAEEGGPINDIGERMRNAIDFAGSSVLLTQFGLKDLDIIKFHRQRIVDYLYFNMAEDETLTPIAVEQGFSYLLFEDHKRRYILEGKIDLICKGRPYGLAVMDHKTQSRFDDRYELNHQVMNYLNFTKAEYFIYNYIGLQDKLPPNGLRRMIYKPHPGMLEQWAADVRRTFREMESYRAYRDSEHEYPRRRCACDASKYGLCPFYKMCAVPDDSIYKECARSAYKIKEEKWQAWR